MASGGLGKVYKDGEVIIREGEVGHEMYVIQEGQVQILKQRGEKEVPLRTAGVGELLGEMAIFDHEVRSATIRALGEARVLTVDKKTLLTRINEDPSLAFRLVQNLSKRVRELSTELARLKGEG